MCTSFSNAFTDEYCSELLRMLLYLLPHYLAKFECPVAQLVILIFAYSLLLSC